MDSVTKRTVPLLLYFPFLPLVRWTADSTQALSLKSGTELNGPRNGHVPREDLGHDPLLAGRYLFLFYFFTWLTNKKDGRKKRSNRVIVRQKKGANDEEGVKEMHGMKTAKVSAGLRGHCRASRRNGTKRSEALEQVVCVYECNRARSPGASLCLLQSQPPAAFFMLRIPPGWAMGGMEPARRVEGNTYFYNSNS